MLHRRVVPKVGRQVGDLVGVRRLERSAHRLLDRLHQQVGVGLVAAAAVPGVAAAFDQHTASVREILTTGIGPGATVATSVLLAGYARGVLDHVRERGGQVRVPTDTAGWRRADWFSMRLLAVCALARAPRLGHQDDPAAGRPSLA